MTKLAEVGEDDVSVLEQPSVFAAEDPQVSKAYALKDPSNNRQGSPSLAAKDPQAGQAATRDDPRDDARHGQPVPLVRSAAPAPGCARPRPLPALPRALSPFARTAGGLPSSCRRDPDRAGARLGSR